MGIPWMGYSQFTFVPINEFLNVNLDERFKCHSFIGIWEFINHLD